MGVGPLRRASLYSDYGEILSMDPDLDCDIDYQLAQPGRNETPNNGEINEQMIANAREQRTYLPYTADKILGKVNLSSPFSNN